MASLPRRMQRQVSPSQRVHRPLDERGEPDFKKPLYANPARAKFYMGRGSKLGVHNPKDKALIARLKREAARAA